MTPKQAYRVFLQSDFWKKLTALKKSIVRRCERCGKRKQLQSHHIEYPADWYETTLEHLEVLCRNCHQKEHGRHKFFPFLGRSERFNRYLHRLHHLTIRIARGVVLRARDESFLKLCEKQYPPTKKDRAMQFRVNNVRQMNSVIALDRIANPQNYLKK